MQDVHVLLLLAGVPHSGPELHLRTHELRRQGAGFKLRLRTHERAVSNAVENAVATTCNAYELHTQYGL